MKKKNLFFPEQLKAALKYGYKIELINGHEFSRFNLFNEYIGVPCIFLHQCY